VVDLFGAPDRIRTCDLCLRRVNSDQRRTGARAASADLFLLDDPRHGAAQAPHMESSGRAHSVPRPAYGGAMLTLLRAHPVARLQRRPELDGASRPLRTAGSWQPSFLR